MIVTKFGGTSVGSSERIRAAGEIVRRHLSDRPVVVVSAHAGVTNLLLEMAQEALDREVDVVPVTSLHQELIEDLDLPRDLLDDLFEDLSSLLRGITLVKELTPRSLDYIVSFGERMSSRIVAASFRKLGMDARALLAWDLGLVTDSNFGAAHPLEESYPRIRRSLETVAGVPVITGFIAKDRDGNITTLGRSGSDYTASIVGAAIRAREIQIWTDVRGVMTADPRIVLEARSIPELTFAEASELAYYGARVIHPSTMIPAVKERIPIRVLCTHEPDHPGTVIVGASSETSDPVRSIAHKRGLTLIQVVSTRMLLQHGFMARLFDVFARHEVVVDMISTSEVSVSITTDSSKDLEPCVKELTSFADVSIERKKGIVCLVGAGIRGEPETMATIFDALRATGVRTRMISVGATGINVSLLLDEDDVVPAVVALHEAFYGSVRE